MSRNLRALVRATYRSEIIAAGPPRDELDDVDYELARRTARPDPRGARLDDDRRPDAHVHTLTGRQRIHGEREARR